MEHAIRELYLFLREGITNFYHTGSVCATSKKAAEALSNPLKQPRQPKNILEAGSGAGSVTTTIIDDMIDGDYLLLVEINPKFMRALKKRLEDHPNFQTRRSQIEFFEGPIQEAPEEKKFDVVVCSLPFTNFELKTIEEIFEKLKKMTTDNAVMTYYEYMGLRKISKCISPEERKKRISELDDFLKKIHKKAEVGHNKVWLNFLPINIYTIIMHGKPHGSPNFTRQSPESPNNLN